MSWREWDQVEVLDYLTNRLLYSHERFSFVHEAIFPPDDKLRLGTVRGIPCPEPAPRYWKKVTWA